MKRSNLSLSSRFFILTALCLFLILESNAQNNVNCDSLLKKKYNIREIKDKKLFLEEVRTLILCKYDSLDMYIFMGPKGDLPLTTAGTLTIKKTASIKAYTVSSTQEMISMREVMHGFSELKKMPDYDELRAKVGALRKIIGQTATEKNWEYDESLLKKAGVDTYTITKIKKIIADNPGIKYEEVFDKLNQQAFQERIVETPRKIGDKEKLIEGLYTYTDYNKGLSKAKESGKPILLYFNSYVSIPARKFEFAVLQNSEILKTLNDHFEVIVLWVDDRTLLAKDKAYYSKSLKRDVKYVGDINMELQVDNFESDFQPLFFTLNTAGQRVASSSIVGVQEFLEFLNKSRK
ncbi:hypothetical protein [Pedobacter frigoris]|uniref:hypothetical protein n=1 Tax=Pedobacter frigoris TaxID=2571272 RepID=UPI00293096F7|nr:hypothetical protein [Pedobacter frigoris]